VYAWWNSAAGQASNAPYTVNHVTGTSVVVKNQQIDGGK
jgi:hypothetical protein